MKNGKAPFVSEDDLALTLEMTKGINGLRNKAVILLSHFLGLRAKELALLKIGDIYDPNKKSVRETIRLLGVITKGNKFREVYLVDSYARSILQEYITKERSSDQNAPLFLSQKGGAFSPNTMQRMVANCYKKAGIKASSHSGRRSFATRLIRKNVDIYSIQQLMGHSSISVTQIYFASDPIKLREAVLKLSI